MARCTLTDDERHELEQQLLDWQNHAMRTLAVAEGFKVQDAGFKLLAIFAISDPLRKEVPAAIRQCNEAGIDVKIVTGDTVATAMEIARQCGITELRNNGTTEFITGAEFAALSDEEALECVKELKVMSRARPTDKQRLVSLLQQRGEVVAVTVQQHRPCRDVGALAIQEHPAFPLLPAHRQRSCPTVGTLWWYHWYRDAADHYPDTMGEPDYGHTGSNGIGLTASFA